jgi:hypothetical protein
VILNYNHDGLATDSCSRFHRVIVAHGTIEAGYGSPSAAELIAAAREFDFPVTPDELLLCIPESYPDLQLVRRLLEATRFQPHFIAIIGYSFGRSGETFDNRVLLDFFVQRFREFLGNIYVIEPDPTPLRDTLAERLKCRSVFGVRAYWNLLAHAMLEKLERGDDRKSLNYFCEETLDRSGSGITFPLPRE